MMLRLAMTLAALLSLAACAGDPPKPVPSPQPLAVAPPPVSRPPKHQDACGAGLAQVLVGRSRRQIPVPVFPALQRVACTTCPITQDDNPRRLNFFYDAETGLIKEVKCG